jgi:hypothetical protein
VPLVLAIEPDIRQAAIVKRIVREKVLADVTVVDSRDAALEAIRTTVPDVLLLSALLSPRDEDELIAHLRMLDAGHLQTHTIPQLASALTPGEGRGGGGLLSSFFRKKKEPDVAPGCDPDLFAEEIRTYLKRAEDRKRERQNAVHPAPDMRLGRNRPQQAPAPAVEAAEETPSSSSSWASPFEWKPSGSTSSSAARHAAAIPHVPTVEAPAPAVESAQEAAGVEPLIRPAAMETAHDESILAEEPEAAPGARASLIPEPGLPKTMSLIPNPESVIVTADDPDEIPRRPLEEAAPEPGEQPVAVLREPSVLIPQPVSVLVHDAPSIDLEASIGDDAFPEITLVEDPIEIEEQTAPSYAAAARDRDAAAETVINLDAVGDDTPAVETRADGGFTFLDPGFVEGIGQGFGIDDRGFGVGDSGSAIRDSGSGLRGVGPLASWARTEKREGTERSTSDDLRMLLAGLAVPASIAGVRYAAGVRIRRVRVPASQAADAGDNSGPVILSRRALAEQREQTNA